MTRYNKLIIDKLRIFILESKLVSVLNSVLKLLIKDLKPLALKLHRNIVLSDIIRIYHSSRGKLRLIFLRLLKLNKKFKILSIGNLIIQRNSRFKKLISDLLRLIRTLRSSKLRFLNYLKSLGLRSRHVRYVKTETLRGYFALVTGGWNKKHLSNFTKIKKRLDGVVVYLSVNDQNERLITLGKF